MGDALYATAASSTTFWLMGKQAIAVLKDERAICLQDARSYLSRWLRWSPDGRCQSWTSKDSPVATGDSPVRVVRSVETRIVRRANRRAARELISDWMWVTTLSSLKASARP